MTDIQVGSTVDEARAVRAFAEHRGWDSLMIVTDPYHSFRARIIFRRELMEGILRFTFVLLLGIGFDPPTGFSTLRDGSLYFLRL